MRHAGVLRASIRVDAGAAGPGGTMVQLTACVLDFWIFPELSAPLVSVKPFVDQGMSHRFRLLAVAVYDFSGHFNVPGMNRYDPLVSLNPSADGISYTSMLHSDMLHSNSKLSNALRPTWRRAEPREQANICRDEASRCLGNFFRAWRSLLRFLDLPVHQVTKVWWSISRRPEGAPSRCTSSIDW